MTSWLRSFILVVENPSLVLSMHPGQLTTPVTPDLWDLMPFKTVQAHKFTCTFIHRHIHMHIAEAFVKLKVHKNIQYCIKMKFNITII